MKKRVNPIPKFKTLAEEAKFWDTHSFADYWDQFQDMNLVVELHKPAEETLILRIQKTLKNQLAKIAKKKGVSVSSLSRMWLMERLRSSGARQ